MIVYLNAEERQIELGTTISTFIDIQGFSGDPIAVSVNRIFVPRSNHASFFLKENDNIEFIAPMQGG